MASGSTLVGAHLRGIGRVIAVVFRSPDLRREQIAYLFFNTAEWAVWIAMLVYAFGRGGASMASAVALIQLVPAALFAPFGSVLADRYRPARVLVWGYLVQATALTATGIVLLLSGPSTVAYATAAVAAMAVTVTRPTLATLVPALAHTADELTATNVVSGWNESLSVLVAPAIAGALLVLSSPGWVFLLMAMLLFAGTAIALRVQGPPPLPIRGGGAVSQILDGARVLRREPAARLLVGLLGSQYVAIGMLDVLYVVLAIDALSMGQGGAGFLNAAFGAGAAVSIAFTATLVGRARLMPAVVTALAVWGAAFVVMTVWTQTVAALLLLAVAGAARSFFDVAGRTLLQRTTPAEVMARVFGLLESLIMAATAVGALIAPTLVRVGGATAITLGVAATMPLLALIGGRRLLALDQSARVPIVEIRLLRSLRLFAALSPPVLEGLAQSLEPITAEAGEVIVRQGERGETYFAVASGHLEVTVDGERVRMLSRGDGFGEIALIHQVPRTATIRALTHAQLYALDKAPFHEVLTGHPAARTTAHTVAAEHLTSCA